MGFKVRAKVKMVTLTLVYTLQMHNNGHEKYVACCHGSKRKSKQKLLMGDNSS